MARGRVGIGEVEPTTKVIMLLAPSGIFRNLPEMSWNFIWVAWRELCWNGCVCHAGMDAKGT